MAASGGASAASSGGRASGGVAAASEPNLDDIDWDLVEGDDDHGWSAQAAPTPLDRESGDVDDADSSDEEEGDCVHDDDMDDPPAHVSVQPTAAQPAAAAAGSSAAAAASTGAAPAARAPPRRVSMAHAVYVEKKLVYIHCDVETALPGVIVQLSAIKTDQDGNQLGEPFNHYVKPPIGTRWNMHEDACCHGLQPGGPKHHKLSNAEGILAVWPKFVYWIEADVGPEHDGRHGCFVCWAGKACDLKAMHETVDIAYSGQLRWPSSTPYFFDPLKITSYVGCPWHDFAHVKNYGAALGVVYRHATGSALTGAHDAIEDVKGQIEPRSA